MKLFMQTRRALIVAALMLTSVVGLSLGTASAQNNAVSDEQARQIALRQVPGTVVSLRRETDDGVAVIEVDVRSRDGVMYEVEVDATNGRIREFEQD